MLFTLIALILRIFANPVANLFQKKISAEGSSLYTNFYAYFILSVCTVPFALMLDWSALPSEFWILAFTAGALCATGTACLIKALQIGELSILGPINSYKSVVGMFIAIFFLHEVPGFWGLLGMFFIIWGSRFVLDTTAEGFGFKIFLRKDILLRIIALIFTGTEAVLLKKVILLSSVEMSFMSWAWSGALFSFILILITRRAFVPIKKQEITGYTAVCLSLAIMQLSTNFVFERMNVGYALALFQLSTIVNLIFGFKFFHETDMKKKFTGTIIMTAGSIMIILCS